MSDAAARQEYEEAAVYRNRIAAVKRVDRSQPARLRRRSGWSTSSRVATDGGEANAQVFQVRDGILADRKSFHLDNNGEVERQRGRPRNSSRSTTRRAARFRRR